MLTLIRQFAIVTLDWAAEMGKLSDLFDTYWPIYGGAISALLGTLGTVGGIKISQLIANVKVFTNAIRALQTKTNGVIDTFNAFTGSMIAMAKSNLEVMRVLGNSQLNPMVREAVERQIAVSEEFIAKAEKMAKIANIDLSPAYTFVDKVADAAQAISSIASSSQNQSEVS